MRTLFVSFGLPKWAPLWDCSTNDHHTVLGGQKITGADVREQNGV